MLSIENRSDSSSTFGTLLRMRNNQVLLSVLDVDKQRYVHVLSTAEVREARRSITFLIGFLQ